MEILRWKAQDRVASKRSPLILRMVVVILSVVCGLYSFSIYIQPTNTSSFFRRSDYPLKVEEEEEACSNTGIEEQGLPHPHFPKPRTFSRQECACNPVRFFVIVSMQRSGSGWFETLLNSHPNLSSNGEIFGQRERRTNVSAIYNTLDTVYNLDWLSSASKNDCSAAVGFKWMLNQGLMEYHEEIANYLRRRGVSIIFLFRRNLLRRMISLLANKYDKEVKLLNGTHKSHVHTPLEAQILAGYKPKVNVTILVSSLRSTQNILTEALDNFRNIRHIVLYYEDILANGTRLMDVQEFLKLPQRNLTSLQVKIHKGPLATQISNYEDVQKALKGTPYQIFINATDYN